jgi:hypothetical protein
MADEQSGIPFVDHGQEQYIKRQEQREKATLQKLAKKHHMALAALWVKDGEDLFIRSKNVAIIANNLKNADNLMFLYLCAG